MFAGRRLGRGDNLIVEPAQGRLERSSRTVRAAKSVRGEIARFRPADRTAPRQVATETNGDEMLRL
jgi:hypothetical protein